MPALTGGIQVRGINNPSDLDAPEPWSQGDNVIPDVLSWGDQFGLNAPDFLIDYENLPPIIPANLQNNHVRSSVATTWNKYGNLVEDASGVLRLQRDPVDGSVLGLLYEPKRTQLISNPTSHVNWTLYGGTTVTKDTGTSKGQFYDKVVESSNDESHGGYESATSGDGVPISYSMVAKANGRNWLSLEIQVIDGTNSSKPTAWFDLQNGSLGTVNNGTYDTLINHAIKDLGGGWYRCALSISPDSGFSVGNPAFRLANGDGVTSYSGDGSSSILALHSQVEESREATSPILQGGGVKEADEVLYQFGYPQIVVGGAYSINQQNADKLNNKNFQPGITMAVDDTEKLHGFLAWNGGLDDSTDGWKTAARNTDDPKDSASTNFLEAFHVETGTDVTITVRQLVAWTQTLTSTQKTDLKNKYLMTP